MVSFLVLLLLPAAAVIWLGVELLRHDKDLELRQRRERLESASDRVVASLEQALSAAERRLGSPRPGADDAIVVRLLPTGLEAAPPGQLLYYPSIPVLGAEPASPFAAGEALEYQASDFAKAAEVFRALAHSPRDDVRAGALLRLARNLKKLDRPEAAMDAYDRLATLDRTTVAGLPGDLLARRARCLLLQELGRHEALQREARALRDGLLGMRWKIDRGTLTTYLEQIHDWTGVDVTLPPEREAQAVLVEQLWGQFAAGRLPASGRIASQHAGVPLAAVWQSTRDEAVALVAGPRFVSREWLGPAAAAAPGIDLTLVPPDADAARQTPGAFSIHRRPGETGLPWTVILTDQRVSDESGVVSPRRRLLLAGLSLLVLVVAGGGYFVMRAVGREFAVAQLQSDFVSAVSHEFRTPLTSLQQFTSLLAEADGPSPEKRRTFYRAQARGIERLSRLVESLLDFGRMEAGARTYHSEPRELGSLVQDVVCEFREQTAGSGFTIACRLPDEPVPVRADGEALGRALWNLLDNAVKYSGDGRTIEVAVEIEAGRTSARVGVRDHGVGVLPHEKRDIFEKFVRGESSRVQGIKGTGIGLAMVRHIVAAHGGSIDVSSEPDGGSTFTIVLPVEEGV
jgi:signal transduction histidine kinase